MMPSYCVQIYFIFCNGGLFTLESGVTRIMQVFFSYVFLFSHLEFESLIYGAIRNNVENVIRSN